MHGDWVETRKTAHRVTELDCGDVGFAVISMC